MNVINVPQVIELEDYHDFEFLQEDYRRIIPSIKVREIGFNPKTGGYSGFVYLGTLKDPKNKEMFQNEKKRLRRIEDDFGGPFLDVPLR